ncbi:MAG: hypothetical protein M3N38_06550 [Pseudomonadota bacterium]|nr:hypothetical protein [Pseudomonadota bacterium]
MSERGPGAEGMSVKTATYVEYGIIGLGILALVLIFQPFSLTLFGVGCALVIFAGLINNLLPLCEPGVPLATLVRMALVIFGIFIAVTALAILAAHLYGVFFVGP